ncbi:MAG: hypothetical protein KTR30_21970 [Saprospiraceae bacterium]|nr:hypothetical protein [Saprospiraceae bacterium]
MLIVPALFTFLALSILGFLVKKNLGDSRARSASQALIGALSIILLALGAVELFQDWYSGLLQERMAAMQRLFGMGWMLKTIALNLILLMASMNIHIRSRESLLLQRMLLILIVMALALEVIMPTPIITPGWETTIMPSWSWVTMVTFLIGSLACLWIIIRWKLIPETRD